MQTSRDDRIIERYGKKIPTFWIEHINDESQEFFVGERSVGTIDHDSDGWEGMQKATKLFRNIASVIGAEVKEKNR